MLSTWCTRIFLSATGHMVVFGICSSNPADFNQNNLLNFSVTWSHLSPSSLFECSQAVEGLWFYCVVHITWVRCWGTGTNLRIWKLILVMWKPLNGQRKGVFNSLTKLLLYSLMKTFFCRTVLFGKILTQGPVTSFSQGFQQHLMVFINE